MVKTPEADMYLTHNNIKKYEGNDMDKMIVSQGDFLEKNFGDRQYNMVITNPPWTGVAGNPDLGIRFIDKAIDLLVEGGKLVCIMGYDQFAPGMKSKALQKKGTFYDLLQRGSFERIETRRADGMWNSADPHFKNSSSIWFIWTKGETGKSFVMNNKVADEFTYTPTGNEWRIPEFNNKKAEELFDYDNGISTWQGDKINGKFRFKWKDGKVIDMTNTKGKATHFIEDINIEKAKKFLEKNWKELTLHYAGNITSGVVVPPIKREHLV